MELPQQGVQHGQEGTGDWALVLALLAVPVALGAPLADQCSCRFASERFLMV